jgi:sulfite exporter TauE/SafE
MTALVFAVLLSSLAGSIHCLAMCGPLVALHGVRTLRLALVHALGRLTTYALLGVAAGTLGKALDLAGELGHVQRIATLVAATVVLGWGLVQLATALGWRRRRSPSAASSTFTSQLVRIGTRRPSTRAWLVGVLTGLLPCGWLWAFVVAAAGTGSPWLGGLTMVAFWLGTVPAMTGALSIGAPIVDWLRQRMPVVTAAALVVLGLGTLALRWSDAGAGQVTQPSCHEVAR